MHNQQIAGITPNRELVQKATLSLATLRSDGGYMPEDTAMKFIRVMIKKSQILKLIRVENMNSHTREISKISFQREVLKPGVSGQALAEGDRSEPNLGQVELKAELFRGEVRLPDETVEDNIESGNFVNVVMQELTKAVSRDAEKVVLNGDTALPGLLGVLDGIRKQASSNVLAAGGTALNRDVMRDMSKVMPSEFFEDPENMLYITSRLAEIDYRDSVATRETASGDRALGTTPANSFRDTRIAYNGIPVQRASLMPENLGAGLNETEALLLNPANVHMGWWRRIRIETDKDVSSGMVIIAITARFDVKYAHEPAVVKATGITVG